MQSTVDRLAFSLQNILVRRNGTHIVEDINWTVKQGEHWVLLGPNGIGKSTLINIIGARMFPTSGSVEVLGSTLGKCDVFNLRPRIGILSADLSTHFGNGEKVLEIVATGKTAALGTWGDFRDDDVLNRSNLERARMLLSEFGAEKILERNWGVLSQGERKRVQMARALMPDPELILFDEPTAGLDLRGREQVINTLNKLSSKQSDNPDRTIVLVNHNVEEIPPAFDKIAIMGTGRTSKDSSHGKILFQGNIRETLTSANLTAAYGIDLNVLRTANLRYFASTSVILDIDSQ